MLKSDEGGNVSYWEATSEDTGLSASADVRETDVCIIGGGISGLTTAYLLSKSGVDVTVIDDGPIAAGETSRTTAHLAWAIDDRIYRVAEWHGDEHAKLAVAAHASAVDKIESIVSTEKIDCDFSRLDAYLVEAEANEDDLDKELETCQRLGVSGVERANGVPGSFFNGKKALRFANHGQFHVLKYTAGLRKAIEAARGHIISGTRAHSWDADEAMTVETDAGTIRCRKAIVLATNYPLKSHMFAELPAYRTYVIGARVAKGSVPRQLVWDTGEPYHYVRIQEEEDRDILIVGGEDHRTGQADDGEERFNCLWQWTKEHFPAAEGVEYKWSGQVFETHDGLAFIGRYSSSYPNVYLITGDSGMGMTHGTIGGMLVSDLILGRENELEKVFDPSRKLTQSLTEAIPEVIASTVPYADWVKPSEVSSYDDIANGEGAVIKEGLSPIAAFRDESGNLHKHSAVCTHMGCVVRFNSSEKTWDCPCHGSRFDCRDGHVINSPAIEPLGKAE
jgi:glycine/D-amino acid oxidase-like deaminating enzyme/nitrite reductase/ring-hydroxylating ferredoxin subunit